MSPLPNANRPAAWIGLAAVVVLSVGIAAGLRQMRPAPPPAVSPPPIATEPDTSSDGVIDRALQLIPPGPVDSLALKSQWQDVVQGVDVSALDPRQREVFVRFANAERCTCGCGYTLAACRAYDASCETSPRLLDALLDSVKAGLVHGADGVRKRPAG
jgi:hypothetical protein